MEVVITISVMGVLMTLVATALFRMYRQESLMVERTFQTSVWLKLNREFREDIHAATSVTQSADGRLELTTSGETVIWLADGENVRRIVPADGAAVEPGLDNAAKLPGERYAFADSSSRLLLTKPGDAATAIASVEVTLPATATGATVQPLVASVAVGLDHRFASAGSTSEGQP